MFWCFFNIWIYSNLDLQQVTSRYFLSVYSFWYLKNFFMLLLLISAQLQEIWVVPLNSLQCAFSFVHFSTSLIWILLKIRLKQWPRFVEFVFVWIWKRFPCLKFHNFALKYLLTIHWRFSTTLKSAWRNVFWYVKVHIFQNYIQYTIHWNKTQNVKKTLFGQNKQYKTWPPFFRELQLIMVLLLICGSYLNWSTNFVSLKLCVWDFPFSIRIIEKPHTILLPDLWVLSCNKKF